MIGISMLGLIEDKRHTTTQWFKEAGDVILLLGATRNDLGASELLSVVADEVSGSVPRLDLEAEKAVTIGETGGSNLSFTHSGKTLFEVEVSKLDEEWRDALPIHMDRLV